MKVLVSTILLATLSLNVAAQSNNVGQFTVAYCKSNNVIAAVGVAPLSSASTIAFSWTGGAWDFDAVNAISSATTGETTQSVAVAGEGEIIISQADATAEAAVFDLTGKAVYRGKARRIPVASGLYLVTINGQTVKVIIR